jgi:hypothetical protein
MWDIFKTNHLNEKTLLKKLTTNYLKLNVYTNVEGYTNILSGIKIK